MVKEWPRQQALTKVAVKKERPLEEKVLADVNKKLSEIEKMLEPALENSSLSSTTKEAEQTAHAVVKVCVSLVTFCCVQTNFNIEGPLCERFTIRQARLWGFR